MANKTSFHTIQLGNISSYEDYEHFFPDSSAGKESACNAGDPGSIPGLGRSPGEGIGYPLQYSRASLVAQMVQNPPAVRDTWFDPWVGRLSGYDGDAHSKREFV